MEEIVKVIAQFKADLLWDDIVGIFEMVPPGTKEKLEEQFEAAVKAAEAKLGAPIRDTVEDLAFQKINGLTYSQEDINARLKEYGINPNEAN